MGGNDWRRRWTLVGYTVLHARSTYAALHSALSTSSLACFFHSSPLLCTSSILQWWALFLTSPVFRAGRRMVRPGIAGRQENNKSCFSSYLPLLFLLCLLHFPLMLASCIQCNHVSPSGIANLNAKHQFAIAYIAPKRCETIGKLFWMESTAVLNYKSTLYTLLHSALFGITAVYMAINLPWAVHVSRN